MELLLQPLERTCISFWSIFHEVLINGSASALGWKQAGSRGNWFSEQAWVRKKAKTSASRPPRAQAVPSPDPGPGSDPGGISGPCGSPSACGSLLKASRQGPAHASCGTGVRDALSAEGSCHLPAGSSLCFRSLLLGKFVIVAVLWFCSGLKFWGFVLSLLLKSLSYPQKS